MGYQKWIQDSVVRVADVYAILRRPKFKLPAYFLSNKCNSFNNKEKKDSRVPITNRQRVCNVYE